MIYLASPYSSPDALGREIKYKQVLAMTAKLVEMQLPVFSPIVHSHHIAKEFDLPGDHNFWMVYDAKMLRSATEVWMAQIEGHETSQGMLMERAIAIAAHMPIRTVDWHPEDKTRLVITPELKAGEWL